MIRAPKLTDSFKSGFTHRKIVYGFNNISNSQHFEPLVCPEIIIRSLTNSMAQAV